MEQYASKISPQSLPCVFDATVLLVPSIVSWSLEMKSHTKNYSGVLRRTRLPWWLLAFSLQRRGETEPSAENSSWLMALRCLWRDGSIRVSGASALLSKDGHSFASFFFLTIHDMVHHDVDRRMLGNTPVKAQK